MYRPYHIITICILNIHSAVDFSACFIGKLSKYSTYAKHIDKCCLKREESLPVTETIISGVQPSGKLHLGNYFGCIYPCLKAQENRKKINFMIANLHSITSAKNLLEIAQNSDVLSISKQALAISLACGLNPSEGTRFFYQSQIANILKLNWIIACLVSANKIQGLLRLRNAKFISLGLVCYPVLMSSDILSIRATKVIANKDQTPHVELARFIAKKLNSFLGKEFFPLTEIDTSESSSIMSLSKPTEKMSKCETDEHSRIDLLDPPEVVFSKIRDSVTDSVRGLSIEPEKRPGVTNLIRIYSKCSGIAQDTAIRDFSDAGFIEFKRSVAEVVIEFLRPIQQRYNEIIKDSQYLDKVANDGVEHINSISDEVIKVFDWLF